MPPTVTAESSGADVVVRWEHPNPGDVFRWVVYFRVGEEWSWLILPRQAREATLAPPTGTPTSGGAEGTGGVAPIVEVAVSAVDRVGNESRPTFWRTLR